MKNLFLIINSSGGNKIRELRKMETYTTPDQYTLSTKIAANQTSNFFSNRLIKFLIFVSKIFL